KVVICIKGNKMLRVRINSAFNNRRRRGFLHLGGLLLLPLLSSVTSPDASCQSTPAFKYEEPKSLTGTIYSLDRKTVLFRFSRRSTRSGNQLEAVREYTYPDGKLAARERVIYNSDDMQPYELQELQIGEYDR